MQNGKIIIARLWPKFASNIPSAIPVILGLDKQKYETIAIYLTRNCDIPNLLQQNNKKVFYLTSNSELKIVKPLLFFRLAKILKDQQVDILHCHHHKAAFYGAIAGRLAKTPVIISHIHGLKRTRNINRKITNRIILPLIDKIFTVGEAVRQDILKDNKFLNPEKVINIGNSIDCEYYSNTGYDRNSVRQKYNIPPDALVFATAARLAQTKGQQFLIEAFATVHKQLKNSLLLIAGEGEMKDELELLAVRLNCNSAVRFLGHIENMPEFYSMTDFFVLPSIAEGLPRTLMEAMAAGVLCIASDTGGIPEIITSEKTGILTPAGNSHALAKAMLNAANMSPEQKNTIINNAKEHIKTNFSNSSMIEKLQKIYETSLREKM